MSDHLYKSINIRKVKKFSLQKAKKLNMLRFSRWLPNKHATPVSVAFAQGAYALIQALGYTSIFTLFKSTLNSRY